MLNARTIPPPPTVTTPYHYVAKPGISFIEYTLTGFPPCRVLFVCTRSDARAPHVVHSFQSFHLNPVSTLFCPFHGTLIENPGTAAEVRRRYIAAIDWDILPTTIHVHLKADRLGCQMMDTVWQSHMLFVSFKPSTRHSTWASRRKGADSVAT
ncbi:hypothetical protein BDZ89DRAFT_693247 [Hymenopellis radicata]|nr:hypothetical protein BDZ89DRAFT_693247 [Hymenopellis radicata]